ncbi:protein kinase [Reinekea marina]|uniref:Protein kinase n=1 Tax=Reinekea marina TaxID=1310421 RepID=A0ABV7WTY0_9GAMM|nr:protein kinase [Reinekea marina]MDN3649692.1 protein kinase [Reinekea marina]
MRHLFFRLFFGLISSFILVIGLFPATHGIDSQLISWGRSLSPGDALEAPLVRVVPSLSQRGELVIKTPVSHSPSQVLSGFQYSYSSESITTQRWLQSALNLFRKTRATQIQEGEHFYWQPAQVHYKTLVSYQEGRSFFDATLNTLGVPVEKDADHLLLNYQAIPIDGFGGLFLNWQAVPSLSYADLGNFDATLISHDTPLAHQFIKEQAALLQELWVTVPNWSFLLAILLATAPWLLIATTSKPMWVALSIGLIEVAIVLYLLIAQAVWVPVLVPAVMLVLATVWYLQKTSLMHRINNLNKAHRKIAGYWVASLLDDSKPESAYRFLVEQKNTLAYSPLWLEVAKGYQRNRQLDKAQLCYEELLSFDPKCTEAKKGLKQLKEVIDGTATMVIGQTRSELPVGHIENLTLGRYHITKELGRGAMGIVYEANDPKINRHVALKVVHLKSLGFDEMDAVKQRFFREAQAAGKLNHPNIVTVYDVGEEHDVAFIAMDLLVGHALSDHISKAASIDVIQRVTWIAQAADALAYAHDHEVIHRDVKPANMIIDSKTNQLKLTDFGVARIAGAQQTQTGVVLGSPSYMSPEQIRGDNLTGQTDVFSLGVTLYQALTQQLPFTGDTLPTLAYAITQSKQVSPRNINGDVPVSLVRIVNKALHKELSDRYKNAAELSQALKKWLAEQNK